jgi:hypothetical protein
MGNISSPDQVLLIIAACSRHIEALQWACARSVSEYGKVYSTSEAFNFAETDYYTASMGPNLKKQFFAFETPIDPAALAHIKCTTNQWEAEYAALGRHAEPRPLNLDPGYITPAKLVLASTKDHAHRIYLAGGIYAEVTLSFRAGRWQPLEWTYPDYRREDYQEFFTACRQHVLSAQPRT